MDPDTTQYDKVKGEWSENLIDIKSNLKEVNPHIQYRQKGQT